MKKTILTLTLVGITISMYAYGRTPGEEVGDAIINFAIVIMCVLNIILFIKISSITENVEELRKKICPFKSGNKQLLKQMLKLDYLGKSDEAKKMLDENLTNEIFEKIFLVDKTVDYKKTEISKIIEKYEKYYKILNAEMPSKIKNIDIDKAFLQYRSV